jgi:hypothetical protein
MVFLVLTRSGFESLRSRIDPQADAVWFNAGVMSSSERTELQSRGWNISWFVDPLDQSDLRSDIATIEEHHPNQVVWVEGGAG